MNSLKRIQHFQLRLVESATVSESCASDLTGILCKLTAVEAKNVRGIIELLQHEAETLRGLSKGVTANHLFAQPR